MVWIKGFRKLPKYQVDVERVLARFSVRRRRAMNGGNVTVQIYSLLPGELCPPLEKPLQTSPFLVSMFMVLRMHLFAIYPRNRTLTTLKGPTANKRYFIHVLLRSVSIQRCRLFSPVIFLNAAWVPSHAVVVQPAPSAPASETIHSRRRRVGREPVGDAARLVDARQVALFRQCLRLSHGKPQSARGRRRGGGGSTRAARTRREVGTRQIDRESVL